MGNPVDEIHFLVEKCDSLEIFNKQNLKRWPRYVVIRLQDSVLIFTVWKFS